MHVIFGISPLTSQPLFDLVSAIFSTVVPKYIIVFSRSRQKLHLSGTQALGGVTKNINRTQSQQEMQVQYGSWTRACSFASTGKGQWNVD